mmetsp:Transcript_109215/g.308015  ORF Transcript_109215/g.308015 Transcript_109215/m.308015 type:complete len:218 (+) Transcript_109215:111-764(+)
MQVKSQMPQGAPPSARRTLGFVASTPRGNSAQPARFLGSKGLERSFGLAPPSAQLPLAPEPAKSSLANAAELHPGSAEETQLVRTLAPRDEDQGGWHAAVSSSDDAARRSRPDALASTADWVKNEEFMKKAVAKDRVAFLLYRAPDVSYPSKNLKELEQRRAVAEGVSGPATTMKLMHTAENHVSGEPHDRTWTKKKDRMTEFTEAKLLQANIGFRK